MKSAFKQHQATSHAGAEQRFKGGLADNSEATAQACTPPPTCCTPRCARCWATEVAQKGSNITAERLRFDFSFGRKMTKEELAEVERLVNEAIRSRRAGDLRGDDRGRGQGAGRYRPVREQVRRARQGLHHGPVSPRRSAAARTPATPAI